MGLDEWKTLTDILVAVVTTIAVIVGGLWAYFKLIKGRTFRPHVEVGVSAEWLGADGNLGLKVSVQVKNIGAAKVELLQNGTGTRISRIAGVQEDAPAERAWESLGVYEIFLHHEWIEPGETIVDDLLIRLPVRVQVIEVQTRIVLAWRPDNVVVHSRRICSPANQVANDTLANDEPKPSQSRGSRSREESLDGDERAEPTARGSSRDRTLGGGQRENAEPSGEGGQEGNRVVGGRQEAR